MGVQKEAIDALKAAGLRDKVKIMVGGAPVTQSFADEIGADAYSPDAATAAEVCRAFYN
jgi:5-methyltetrahydrofolate--homocysteine methyltransferase